MNSITERRNDNFLVYVNILPQEVEEAEEDSKGIKVSTLFDSGAINNNYIGVDAAHELERRGAIVHRDINNKNMVCSGLGKKSICKKASGYIQFKISFLDEHDNVHDYKIKATIVDIAFDLILGRETIKDLNITDLFPSHFKHFDKDSKVINDSTISVTEKEETESCVNCLECTLGRERHKQDGQSVEYLNVMAQTEILRTLTKEARDDDGIDDDELTVFPWNNFQKEQTMPNIYGSVELQEKLRQVCKEFKAQFATEINEEPSKIEPMSIEVDEEFWQGQNYPY